MNEFIKYLFGPCIASTGNAISPPIGWIVLSKNYLRSVWVTILLAFIATFLSYHSEKFFGHYDLYDAIKDGISSQFWGFLILAGAAITCLASLAKIFEMDNIKKYLISLSLNIMNSAISAGALTFGILSAMFILALIESQISSWDLFLNCIIITFAMSYFLFLNLLLWWFRLSIQKNSYRPELLVYINSSPNINLIFTLLSLFLIFIIIQ